MIAGLCIGRKDEDCSEMEQGMQWNTEEVKTYRLNATDIDKQLANNDLHLFPGRLSVEQAKKLPMTFVMTSEFDHYERDAVHVARTLEKAGRLAGWSKSPAAQHWWHFDSRLPESREFLNEW